MLVGQRWELDVLTKPRNTDRSVRRRGGEGEHAREGRYVGGQET
jgi:hypothetical protein